MWGGIGRVGTRKEVPVIIEYVLELFSEKSRN